MKTFIIEYQNLETRLDVDFYNPEYQIILDKMGVETCQLGDLVEFRTETWNLKDFYPNRFPYIEISAINTKTGRLEKIAELLTNKAPSRARKIVRNGDILVSKTRPNRGAITTINFEKPLIASTGFSVISKVEEKINKDYLFYFLRSSFALKQMEQRSSGGNYPAITQEELEKVRIKILDPLSQQEIVDIMQFAYQKKEKLEQEAEKLAKNNYKLLFEKLSLEFTIPRQEKAFVVGADDIIENRIDPMFYSNVKNYIIQTITDSKYTVKPLSELIIGSSAGCWGNDETKKKGNEIAVNVVRNTNFDNKINLNLEKIAVRYVEPSRIENTKLSKGDLLIEKSGGSPAQPVGRVCLWDKDFPEDYIFSNFLQKISIDQEQCLPEYLFVYLRALYSIGLMEYFQNQTTGIKNLIWEEFVGSPIILPTLGVQRELAEFVLNRNKEIIKLEEKAEKILEQAKAQVEEILLNR